MEMMSRDDYLATLTTEEFAALVDVDRPVAVKLLTPALVSTDTGRKRFEREAKAISRLTSNNTITLYDFGIAIAGANLTIAIYQHGYPQSITLN